MLFESISDITKIFSPAENRPRKTLAEQCGFKRDDRLIIVNADDYGLCPSTNHAGKELFLAGEITSVSVLAGAEGSREGMELIKELDIPAGVHLTLTSEWEDPILNPVLPPAQVRSLLTGKGRFYSEIRYLYLAADEHEVEAECRAQIQKVLESGVKVDHLDTHMGVLQLRPDYVEIYLRLAREYNLPIRLGSASLAEIMGMSVSQLREAREAGFIYPDNLAYIPMSFTGDKHTRFAAYDYALSQIPPGITELYFHPTLNGPDFQNLQHEYSKRKNLSYESIRLWDFEYLSEGRISRAAVEEGLIRINYRKLQELLSSNLSCPDSID